MTLVLRYMIPTPHYELITKKETIRFETYELRSHLMDLGLRMIKIDQVKRVAIFKVVKDRGEV